MTQARYDAVADFYASGFDSADDPATRGLLDLLGPVDGLRVVDVACGRAAFPRLFRLLDPAPVLRRGKGHLGLLAR